MTELAAALRADIEQRGPIGFDEFQLNALYASGGFYEAGAGAGRRRDFLTSPEVGPLFGAVIARALDAWWVELGQPEHLTLVEVGAGPGTLARSLLAAEPRCLDALHLVLVERTEVQWSTHPPRAHSSPVLPAPGDLPDGPVIVLANELLDNLPVAVAERAEAGWAELLVDVAPEAAGSGPSFEELLRPLAPDQQRWCDARAPHASIGARIPIQADAAAWLSDALALASPGRVVLLDYARTTAEMAAAPWSAWLRTYARHGPGAPPLQAPGSQDITCDVAIDQLELVAPADGQCTQAEFLRQHGIGDLVARARERWDELGFAGGLAALQARSAVGEAEALLDPSGLGGFTVLEWIRT